jgi:hypothetical protein
MSASRDWKKDLAKAAFVVMPMVAPLVAGAKIDYEGKRRARAKREEPSGEEFSVKHPPLLARISCSLSCRPSLPLGVGYLGGSEKIDVNNANVRVYSRFPGMYPTVAGKIVSHGPYKTVADLYSISGLTEQEKSILKKYESKFITLEPAPEYTIDRINNVSEREGAGRELLAA